MNIKFIKTCLLLPAFITSYFLSYGQASTLKDEINSIIHGKELKLGFALYDFSSGQSISMNGDDKFPMQSVYKFPIGIALLDCVSKGEFSLDDSLTICKADLSPDLWSPIRERWPEGARLTLSEILTYMVAHSDNSATDFLIHKMGGTSRIQGIITNLGAQNINIRNTEREIQNSWPVQFDNWTTPNAMLHFLRGMNDGKLLDKEKTEHLWKIMSHASTGSVNRLVPKTITFARKTGFSGANPQGLIAAQNDVGIIEFENGQRIAYAIFLTDSTIGTDAGYEVIAQIGNAMYTAYTPTF